VRLVQGDFGRETAYGDDPVEMAQHWASDGAARLHVVDLDGARDGVRANAEVIRRLIAGVSIPVQVGGGVRTVAAAADLLAAGAARVVVGTAAAEDPRRLSEWVAELGADSLIVGVDARDGKVATRGWRAVTDLDLVPFCRQLVDLGVRRVLYTDVGRDGMLGGPDIARTREVAEVIRVIGSGGVGSIDDLRQLAAAGAEAAIIGTALYEGRVRLAEALAC
jgi:phosphoribosylformimino-5-aminoimidazole carboxamide ribotide isomerase